MGFIAALACLICMNFTRQSASASAGLLFAFGLLLGLAMSPTIRSHASANPQALWQAGGATALFIAGCGAIGYATRRSNVRLRSGGVGMFGSALRHHSEGLFCGSCDQRARKSARRAQCLSKAAARVRIGFGWSGTSGQEAYS